jgi:small subunit ribosomal protein S6
MHSGGLVTSFGRVIYSAGLPGGFRPISFLLVHPWLHGPEQALRPEGGSALRMSRYEITYIIRPSFEDPQVDELATHFSGVARNNGGDGIEAERMGKKRLAYEIKKLREGHYVCMKFAGSPDTAKEVIRQMRLHDDILRALLVRL